MSIIIITCGTLLSRAGTGRLQGQRKGQEAMDDSWPRTAVHPFSRAELHPVKIHGCKGLPGSNLWEVVSEEGRKWIKKKNGRRKRPYTARKPRKRRKRIENVLRKGG